MKNIFQRNNNGINKNRKKNIKKKEFQNYYEKTKNEDSKFLKHGHKSKNSMHKTKKEKYNFNFDFSYQTCCKIAFYLIIIFIFIQLNRMHNERISERYEYRYKRITSNNRTYDESKLITFEDTPIK